METKNSITFEIGDVAHSPMYNYTGIIIDIKENNGLTYFILHNPLKPKDHTCSATIKEDSANDLMPCYLQLICKKEDYANIAVRHVFKEN